MEPDSIGTSKPYPYNQVDTLYFDGLDAEGVVEAMRYADEYADGMLEEAQNDEPENDDLTTLTYGYVWRESDTAGPPFAFGFTIDGYGSFTDLEGGPFHLEVEVRLYEMG